MMQQRGRHTTMILSLLMFLLVVHGSDAQLNLFITPIEYYRLTETWWDDGVMLMVNGEVTGEELIIPECVHTISMEWHSSAQRLQYSISNLHSDKSNILPTVQISTPLVGMIPLSPELMSLQFRCSGKGVVMVTMTITISNNTYRIPHKLSLTKRCGDCHDNTYTTGGPCEQLDCMNGAGCMSSRYGYEMCVCPPGYHGKHCEQAWCHPACDNGGYCVKPEKCHCRKGYYGNRCQKAMCHPECQNGGRCVKVGVCQCQPPYHGVRCEQRGVINYITTPKRHQCVCNSTTAVLNCGVMATPPARIAWMKNGLPISKANHHYLILSSHDHSNYSSVLLVYDTSPDDNGWYTCVVSNSAVSDRTSGYLRVSPRCGGGVVSSGNGLDDDNEEEDDDDVPDNNEGPSDYDFN
ncbi:wnt inhibitory factor 1-like [Dysidea avara]|uniref:wnt inhibitory factor 1-like n=1 Tax=Dysidea avara TaxID=196820 RepID=UPI00332ABADA